MGEVVVSFLRNQYNRVFLQYVCTVCTAWGTSHREKRYVCSCRVTISLKYRYGGTVHTGAVLQWMDKSSLGMAGQGGKGEWNKKSKSLPGTESGSDMKGSQKGIFRCISYKSKTRKNEGPLLTGAEDLLWKKVRYTIPSFLHSLLVFSDPRSMRPVGKSGVRKTYHCWRRIRLENI